MSTTSTENKEKREKEKEDLLKRKKEIQEEEVEAKEKTKQTEEAFLIQPQFFIKQFNKNDNDNKDININNKVKRKRLKTNINTNISNSFDDEENDARITFNDKAFLDMKQELLAQQFLGNNPDNDNLYIFLNIYKSEDKNTFILLNLPQNKTNFNIFITNKYRPAQSNQHGIMDFNNFKEYFTNTLQSVSQILDKITSVFINPGFTAVKIQLMFGVLWKTPTVEAKNVELISNYISMNSSFSSSSSSSSLVTEFETRRRYYTQNMYKTNFQKYPLLLVTFKSYMRDIKPFILNQLKDLQSLNSHNSENYHKIIAVYNLRYFLYDVWKAIGGKLGMKSLIFDFVKNHFASTITEYHLCLFACISYLTNPKKCKGGENEKTRMHFTRECFYHFYSYQDLFEEEKELKLKCYKRFVLATEIDRFMSFFQTDINIFKFNDKQNCSSKQHSYIYSSPPELFTCYTLVYLIFLSTNMQFG
jgi:hypothetical protein